MRIVFGTQRRALAVEAPEGPVSRFLLRSFGPFRQALPDGEAQGAPDMAIEAQEGRYRVSSARDGTTVPAPDLPALLTRVEHGITVFLLQQLHRLTHLHAAGAVLPGGAGGGRALVALGASGTGKSSVALAWAREGLALLGDDVILLGEGGLLHPFPRPPKAPLGLLEAAGVSGVEPAGAVDGRPEAWWDAEQTTGWAAGPGRAAALAVLVREESRRSAEARPLGAAEALPHLFDALLDTGTPPAASLARLTDLLGAAPAWEVRFGDAGDAARAIHALAS